MTKKNKSRSGPSGKRAKATMSSGPSASATRTTGGEVIYRAPDAFKPRSGDVLARRWVTLSSITTSTSAEVDQQFSFTLSDLPNYTEFTALYDVYKFRRVRVHFIPQANMCPVNASLGASALVWTAVDYDNIPAAAITDIQQYDTCVLHDGRNPFCVEFHPRPRLDPTSGNFQVDNMWVDCGTSAVVHYGLLVGIPQGTANVMQYYVVAEYELSFKRMR